MLIYVIYTSFKFKIQKIETHTHSGPWAAYTKLTFGLFINQARPDPHRSHKAKLGLGPAAQGYIQDLHLLTTTKPDTCLIQLRIQQYLKCCNFYYLIPRTQKFAWMLTTINGQKIPRSVATAKTRNRPPPRYPTSFSEM